MNVITLFTFQMLAIKGLHRTKQLQKCQETLTSLREEKGSVMIEGALAAGFIFPLLIILIEVSRLFYTAASLQFTLAESQRWAITGNPAFSSACTGLARESTIECEISENAKKYGFNLTGNDIHICPMSEPHCLIDDACGALELVSIRANWPVKVFSVFPGGLTVNVGAKTIARNEPS